MALVATGSRRRAVALGRIGAAASSAAFAAAMLGSCGTRDVYLVGSGVSMEHRDSGGDGRDAGQADVVTPPRRNEAGADVGPVTCETRRDPEQLKPLGVYLMVDQSLAMLAFWSGVSTALQQFVADSEGLGQISVGLQYFPLPPTSSDPASSCEFLQYATPDARIDDPSGNMSLLADSLARHGPSLQQLFLHDRPADAALRGAIVGDRSWILQAPAEERVAIALLVTTPLPSSSDPPDLLATCHPTFEDVIPVARAGIEGWPVASVADAGLPDAGPGRLPAVPTYVLGIGTASDPGLDTIATAGGTVSAYDAGVSDSKAILDALRAIRQSALPCDVAVSPGDILSTDINLELSKPDGSRETLYRVPSAADCGGQGEVVRGQWYPEDRGRGPRARLCPTTCAEARAMQGSTVDVVIGCPTRDLLK